MTTVHIEHPIHDFASWKAAFDRDPADRRGSGVLRYSIFRPSDDPKYVLIDLEFAGEEPAAAFLHTMERIWSSGQAASVLAGRPVARILTVVEQSEP